MNLLYQKELINIGATVSYGMSLAATTMGRWYNKNGSALLR